MFLCHKIPKTYQAREFQNNRHKAALKLETINSFFFALREYKAAHVPLFHQNLDGLLAPNNSFKLNLKVHSSEKRGQNLARQIMNKADREREIEQTEFIKGQQGTE